jgi:Cu/Ag efflux pump CusA
LPLLTALFTTTLLTLFSLPIVYPNFTKLLIKKMSITKLKY